MSGGKSKGGFNYKPQQLNWQSPGFGGSFKTNGRYSYYSPYFDKQNTDNLTQANQGIGNSIGFLRGALGASPEQSINNLFNNPFRESTFSFLSNPINRQYQEDEQNLTNELNARGQIGGSYDALRRMYSARERDFNLNQANLQAMNTSADAYSRMFGHALQSLAGLQGYNNQMFNQAWTPLQQFGPYANLGLQAANARSQAALQQQANSNQLMTGLVSALQPKVSMVG